MPQTWPQSQTPTTRCRPSFSKKKIKKIYEFKNKNIENKCICSHSPNGFFQFGDFANNVKTPKLTFGLQLFSKRGWWFGCTVTRMVPKYGFSGGNLFASKQPPTNGTCPGVCCVVCLFGFGIFGKERLEARGERTLSLCGPRNCFKRFRWGPRFRKVNHVLARRIPWH